MQYEVRAHWDADAGVWCADSDDIPGLVTEARTWDQLIKNIHDLAPELIELNGVAHGTEVPISTVAADMQVLRFAS